MKNAKKKNYGSLPVLPHLAWCLLFVAAPLIFVIYYAFTDANGAFTFENILDLGEHAQTFLLSVELSLIATVVCFIVGYPMAYIMARSSAKRQRVYMLLMMIPMWTNLLIRTYSMMAILDDGGFLNTILTALDMGAVHVVGTKGAVIFGMAYDFLPYMVLPIYTVVSKIDTRLLEAAQDLGCSGIKVITRVVMPLSISGIISGITMVFVPSISTFYISQKLGGGTFELIGDTIERQFQSDATYNIGAAISLVMMILIMISLAIVNKFDEEEEEKR